MIVGLEHQRYRNVRGSTPPWLFFDLKEIMHRLESLTSARIEGNRTTLLSVVENVISGAQPTADENLLELRNIEEAIELIEKNVTEDFKFDRAFISELHRITTSNLVREGSKTPGQYRQFDVKIKGAKHTPPAHILVNELMDELLISVNEQSDSQQHLLRVSVVHHRMAAIHPFDNGNGRTVRLLTYAMLTKYGFIDKKGFRLLNPSAVFCIDRQKYYDMLECADNGGESGLLDWCEFMITGLKTELEKVDMLLDRKFAEPNIMIPALNLALEKKQISPLEYDILRIAMKKNIFQAKDVRSLFGPTESNRIRMSRTLKRMREQKLIEIHPDYKLKYYIKFANNYLLRGVVEQMANHNLLPVMVDEA